jgi:hypothetical protein
MLTRSFFTLATSCALLLASGTTAGAAAKHRDVVDRFSEPYAFAVDCGEFGPYAFENLVAGRQRVQVTEVTADDGTLLQTVFHIGFSETDTNSVTGKSVDLKGAEHEVWDYATNTRTLSGKVFLGTEAGGAWVQDTGRITMTLDTSEPLFVAGPHEAFFAGGVDPLVCARLAG